MNEIAIVGVSGVFPGAANLQELLSSLQTGKDHVSKITATRLATSCIDQEPAYRPGGYLDRIDLFDYRFFNIAKSEAEGMDPQQRLLLELTAKAIYNAGYSLKQFKGTNTGVYMAASESGYRRFLPVNANSMLGNMHSAAAGRVSYVFDLHGPAMMISTACSSSMVAVIEACNHLLLGNIQCAIAGSVRISVDPELEEDDFGFDELTAGNGKCKAFDDAADGIIGGEGGAVLVLKMLETAQRDNDHIHAIIKGFALNQDGGRTVGLTAPSPLAQSEMLMQAWKRAGIDPETISYIEAHGTGTKLGDPIEIKGMTDAFAAFTDKKHFCAISSLKTNIGHLDAAAGVAGIVKAILSLQQRQLFPSLHFNIPNTLIDFDHTAVYVNTHLAAWTPACGIRRAGISSFGLSGTNAHLVLEEYTTPVARDPVDEEYLLLKCSGRTPALLRTFLADIRNFIGSYNGSLKDLCYTLNSGRDDFKYRIVITAKDDQQALLQQMDALLLPGDHGFEQPVADAITCIFCFSGTSLPREHVLQYLIARYETFRFRWHECITLDEFDNSLHAKLFAFEYAGYYLIQSLGITADYMVGFATGNIVIATVTGKITMKEGLRQAISLVESGNSPDRNKLFAYLSKFNNPVCLEIGPGGILYDIISTQNNIPVYKLWDEHEQPSVYPVLAQLYQAGVPVQWERLYQQGSVHRVEAPAYPLEQTRAWFADPLPIKEHAYEESFFDLQWIRSHEVLPAKNVGRKHWLVLGGSSTLAEALTVCLRAQQQEVSRVQFANFYQQENKYAFVIRPDSEADYKQLYMALKDDQLPLGIIHLGNTWQSENTNDIQAVLDTGLHAQFLLTKAFSDLFDNKECIFVMVSTDAVPVTGDESVIWPERSASLGFLRGLLAEYPTLDARCLDFDEAQQEQVIAESILLELTTRDYKAVAYRKGQRYIQSLQPVNGASSTDEPSIILHENGVYLITGGAQGIGYEFAREWASQPVTLVLVGRTLLSDNNNSYYNTHTPHKVAATGSLEERLEELGKQRARIIYYACDIGDPNQVTQLIQRVKEQWGEINGIIHGAALPGRKRIKHNTPEGFKEVLAARIQGTKALVEATAVQSPDFIVVFSSASILLSTARTADYAAGCFFVDTYVRQLRETRKDLKVIHWCGWQETGMAYRIAENREGFAHGKKFMMVKTKEGLAAFDRWMQTPFSNTLLLANMELMEAENRDYFTTNPFFQWSGQPSAEAKQREVNQQSIENTVQVGPVEEVPHSSTYDLATIRHILLRIWKEVLKMEEISFADDFFELGGHSLNGFTILKQIEKEFVVHLEIDDLYDNGTIDALAALIMSQHKVAFNNLAVAPLQEHYALSHAQKRLWILDQLDGEASPFNIQVPYHLHGALDVQALQLSLAAIINRHEILRTVFIVVNNEPVQVILDTASLSSAFSALKIINDLSEDAAVKAIAEEGKMRFDLVNGPLFSTTLFSLGNDKYLLSFVIHHIIFDAWSMNIFIREIAAFYKQYAKGISAGLPDLNIQYKDYAYWQHTPDYATRLTEHQSFWRNLFRTGVPVLELPLSYPRPAQKTYEGKTIRRPFDPVMMQDLRSFSLEQGSSLFMSLLAAVNILLFRYTTQQDIVVGSTFAGREHDDLKDQIGFYVNILPLYTTVHREDHLINILHQVKQHLLQVTAHQVYPFDQLVNDLQVKRNAARSPLFDVRVELYYTDDMEKGLDDIVITPVAPEETISHYDLTFRFVDDNGVLSMALNYASNLFSDYFIASLLDHFMEVTMQLIKDPYMQVGNIPLSGTQEYTTREKLDTQFDLS